MVQDIAAIETRLAALELAVQSLVAGARDAGVALADTAVIDLAARGRRDDAHVRAARLLSPDPIEETPGAEEPRMTTDVAQSALATSVAVASVLQRIVFSVFEQIDPDGFKRMLDEEAERCERMLTQPPQDRPSLRRLKIETASTELRILRGGFDGVSPVLDD